MAGRKTSTTPSAKDTSVQRKFIARTGISSGTALRALKGAIKDGTRPIVLNKMADIVLAAVKSEGRGKGRGR